MFFLFYYTTDEARWVKTELVCNTQEKVSILFIFFYVLIYISLFLNVYVDNTAGFTGTILSIS